MSDRAEIKTAIPHLSVIKTDDGSLTLRDQRLDESFRSENGAASESFQVYLKNSGMLHRMLHSEPASASSVPIRVLEFGFGTGLNYLMLASLAAANQKPLQYVGLERSFLPARILEQLELDQSARQCTEFADLCPPSAMEQVWLDLLDWRRTLADQPSAGTYSIASEFTELQIIVGEAHHQAFDGMAPFDAIFFDPFSPKSSPELWTSKIFDQAYQCLKPGGTLTTYCVASSVRQALAHSHFIVQRVPGPTRGKRQVLLATRSVL